jgi:hypothetical protein
MKKFFLITTFLFCFCFSFSDLNLDAGISSGILQNIFQDREESFYAKFQYGLGFYNYLRLVYNRFLGVEFGFPGFYYIFKSNSKGYYYYPEKMIIPYFLKLRGILDFEKFYLTFSGGVYFPFQMIASYYFPRYFISGIGGDASINYNLTKNFSAGLGVEFSYYFDPYALINFSSQIFLNLNYRVF